MNPGIERSKLIRGRVAQTRCGGAGLLAQSAGRRGVSCHARGSSFWTYLIWGPYCPYVAQERDVPESYFWWLCSYLTAYSSVVRAGSVWCWVTIAGNSGAVNNCTLSGWEFGLWEYCICLSLLFLKCSQVRQCQPWKFCLCSVLEQRMEYIENENKTYRMK